jgi:3-hydroxybutyryl-CoA dehydrogenase
MGIDTVLIVGSGLMGRGIAQVCAQAGIVVFLHDVSQDALDMALKDIDWSVGKFIEKGKLTEDKEVIIGRITTVKSLDAASGVDLAIEAVFE